MNFYTIGKIYEKGQMTSGTSANGNTWHRMTLVLDVQVGQYSKKMAFQVSTANVPAVRAFNTGDEVEVTWDITSREYTNKEGVKSWFTQADLRGIKAVGEQAQPVASTPIPEAGAAQDDDLPFN